MTSEFRQEEVLFLNYRSLYHRLGGCSSPLTAEARIQFQVSPYVIFWEKNCSFVPPVLRSHLYIYWFQTFDVLWMFYSFLWIFPGFWMYSLSHGLRRWNRVFRNLEHKIQTQENHRKERIQHLYIYLFIYLFIHSSIYPPIHPSITVCLKLCNLKPMNIGEMQGIYELEIKHSKQSRASNTWEISLVTPTIITNA